MQCRHRCSARAQHLDRGAHFYIEVRSIVHLWWESAIVFIPHLLELAHCFGKAVGEEVSIFRTSVCRMFVSPLPGGSICLQSNHTTWRMLTDARVCASLKCASATEQMQTHRDKHTNTAGPNTTSPSSCTGGTCSSLGKVTHSSSNSLTESAPLSLSMCVSLCPSLSVIFINPGSLRICFTRFFPWCFSARINIVDKFTRMTVVSRQSERNRKREKETQGVQRATPEKDILPQGQ